MRLIDLIAGRTGADLTPAAVFLHPTPRQLAAHIDCRAGLSVARSGRGTLAAADRRAGPPGRAGSRR